MDVLSIETKLAILEEIRMIVAEAKSSFKEAQNEGLDTFAFSSEEAEEFYDRVFEQLSGDLEDELWIEDHHEEHGYDD